MTTLTPEQQRLIEQAGIEPVPVEDPRNGTAYLIIRADVYEKMRELVELDRSDRSLYEFEDFQPIEDDFDRAIASTAHKLAPLATEALAEHRAGLTEEFDP